MTQRVFTQTFGTVGALIEKEGKILLVCESGFKGIDIGKWNIPEGWIDVGENPVEAAAREAKEETGFSFRPTHLLGIYSMVRKDHIKDFGETPHAIKLVFLGDIDETIRNELHEDVSETKWFSPEEIEKMGIDTLRNLDIKKIVKDYFSGHKYPLEILKHTIQI